MKLTDEAKYEFRTKFPMECVSDDVLAKVKHQVKKRAAEMTKNLACLQDRTCSLDEPQIKGCGSESSSRVKRTTEDTKNKELDIKVSITYHGKFASLSAPGRYRRHFLPLVMNAVVLVDLSFSSTNNWPFPIDFFHVYVNTFSY